MLPGQYIENCCTQCQFMLFVQIVTTCILFILFQRLCTLLNTHHSSSQPLRNSIYKTTKPPLKRSADTDPKLSSQQPSCKAVSLKQGSFPQRQFNGAPLPSQQHSKQGHNCRQGLDLNLQQQHFSQF